MTVRVAGLLLVLWVQACGDAPAAPPVPEGKQGQSARLAPTTEIVVERVTEAPTEGGGVVVRVDWRLVNRGEAPESFRWGNKVLIDAAGRRVAPVAGQDTPRLAPGERSEVMTNEYRLPAPLGAGPWWWGLYVDGALQYRIRLAPTG